MREKKQGQKRKRIVGNVTCPACGHVQAMEIPTTSCQAFYKCEGCERVIAAKKTCCVFCDYGDRMCPVAKQHKKKVVEKCCE